MIWSGCLVYQFHEPLQAWPIEALGRVVNNFMKEDVIWRIEGELGRPVGASNQSQDAGAGLERYIRRMRVH